MNKGIMSKRYVALFVRKDSAYKKREAWDCYDVIRDAISYTDSMPVVAHPPCRAWGVMSHMAFRSKDWKGQDKEAMQAEKVLAIRAVHEVRRCGGVLEHPAGSRLFGGMIPDAGAHDRYGGFTILIDQFDFGHVAHKPTKLYIKGIERERLPDMPPKRLESTDRSIAGNVPGTTRCTQYQREYTPEALIDWFERVLDLIINQGRQV